MNSNIINTNYGQCRCCLIKGNHQDMSKEYFISGIREVYSDIFVDCFNLYLATDHRLSTLICSNCVDQLREAMGFKTKVIDAEKKLLKALPTTEIETSFLNVTDIDHQVKVECLSPCSNASDDSIDNDDTKFVSLKSENRESISYKDNNEVDYREYDLINRHAKHKLRLPTRSDLFTLCAGYVKHLKKLKGKVITAKMIENKESTNKEEHKVKGALVSEKMAHVTNITTLLECSNLTAFKTKFQNGFPCFYCQMIFENLDALRVHQTSHNKENLRKIVTSKYLPGRPDCVVVYADVSNLKCTLCDQELPNINELKSHLTNVHKKILYTEFSDRVIPFKMSNNSYECQVCNFSFETFGSIERHMNTHYRNYVCEDCGAGFIAKHRLKIHRYSIHSRVGKFPCDICKTSYTTRKKYNIHFDLVHKMSKKLKCPKCPMKFSDYFVRKKHLVDAHGETPIVYKCNVCDKAFTRRFALSNHIKRDHLEERDLHCQLCSYSCFNNNELRLHLAKQHGEKLFECIVCNKSYATQKSLSQHMLSHNNAKKFICVTCGLSFVQRRNLKAHLKTHIDVYSGTT